MFSFYLHTLLSLSSPHFSSLSFLPLLSRALRPRRSLLTRLLRWPCRWRWLWRWDTERQRAASDRQAALETSPTPHTSRIELLTAAGSKRFRRCRTHVLIHLKLLRSSAVLTHKPIAPITGYFMGARRSVQAQKPRRDAARRFARGDAAQLRSARSYAHAQKYKLPDRVYVCLCLTTLVVCAACSWWVQACRRDDDVEWVDGSHDVAGVVLHR